MGGAVEEFGGRGGVGSLMEDTCRKRATKGLCGSGCRSRGNAGDVVGREI